MTHPVCREGGPDDGFDYVRRLWMRLLDTDTDFATKLRRLFATETTEFGLPVAFLSRIDRPARVQHVEIAEGDHERLQAEETAPLGRTYCRKTIADPAGTVRVSDALAEGWADDPAYEAFGLGSYLGTTVEADGGLYGTLCFASTEPRDQPIDDCEVALAEMFARWASYAIAEAPVRPSPTWTGMGAYADADGREAALDPRLDAPIDALRRRERRAVLFGLLDGTVQNRSDVAVPGTEFDALQTRLRHNHLPKLDLAGIVDWDRHTGELAKGPDYDRVEPLLRALREHADDLLPDRTDDP